MLQSTPVVFVVDDDPSVRRSLELLIDSAGWQAETFSCGEAFLSCPRAPVPSCLVLDLDLPDLDGLEVQARVAAERSDTPVIFLSGHGDVPATVRAMKGGAMEFLTKPVASEALVAAIAHAIERSAAILEHEEALRSVRESEASLTRREREVMALVVGGLLNKQIAAELDISEITVKAHRGSMMRKMNADSLPHLVNMAAVLGIAPARRRRTAMDAMPRHATAPATAAYRATTSALPVTRP